MRSSSDFAGMVDAYLDGALSGAELSAFEAEMIRSPELREEIELQRSIEKSLRASMQAQDVALPAGAVVAPGAAGGRGTVAPWRQSALYKVSMLGMAAALLLAAGIFTYTQLTGGPGSIREMRPDALYAKVVNAGFTPEWVCTNDAEFAESVRYRLGQPLLVTDDVPGLQVLGWAYPSKYRATPLSDQAMILLSTVDGQPVVTFLDRRGADRPLALKSSKLNLFKREIDGIVLYEVTPKDRPVVIPAMYRPEKMPEAPPG